MLKTITTGAISLILLGNTPMTPLLDQADLDLSTSQEIVEEISIEKIDSISLDQEVLPIVELGQVEKVKSVKLSDFTNLTESFKLGK